MTYVITLSGSTPAPRYDSIPWRTARIEESALRTGPWTAIQTFTLNPVDADPTDPQERDFTSELGTLSTGWYRIVYIDEFLLEDASDPVQHAADPGWSPSSTDVAALIWNRTRDNLGNVLGRFNADTRPTENLVERLCAIAANETDAKVGVIPEAQWPAARAAAALRAAQLVEESYGPEMVDAARAGRLYVQWRDAVTDLLPYSTTDPSRKLGVGSKRMTTDAAVPLAAEGDIVSFGWLP